MLFAASPQCSPTTLGHMIIARRSVLLGATASATGGLVAACSGRSPTKVGELVLPRQVSLSPSPGQQVVERTLTAQATTLDLGEILVDTWAYGDSLPGPLIRVNAGDLVRVTVDNQLPEETTVHWHGIALRNAADGVPGLTQEPIKPGSRFCYEFVAPDPGTYFYHPHVGVQLDRGLYAPLIVDDPAEPGNYDAEWIVVLDDWVDGTGRTPDDVLADLKTNGSSGHGMGGMGGMNMGGMSGGSLFGDAGDVSYPYFLMNGRTAANPDVLRAKPGQRVRLRVINAGADTIFAVALGGHTLSLTHSDGFAVQPQPAEAFYIGMGERYDVMVTLREGVFPLVAQPVGKPGQALALVRTSGGAAPPTTTNLSEFAGDILLGADLMPADSARLPERRAEQELTLVLSGQMGGQMMGSYSWAINGAAYPDNQPLVIERGQRVQAQLQNRTMMVHPIHLHGHTFALPHGLRKDTVLVQPMQSVAVEFDAENPGNWMAHCHNIYHAEAGMMVPLVYTS
jgi:multicopper oxidase